MDKHSFHMTFSLDRAQIIGLTAYAVASGFVRENKNIEWSYDEQIEAARWAIRRMVKVNAG